MGRITASRKSLKPDPKYGSVLASKFVNCLMHDGKKSVAQKVFYDALDIIKEKLPNEEEIEVFNRAIENVKPSIEVRSKRVGGAAYQVPMQVNRNRQQSLALRWILAEPTVSTIIPGMRKRHHVEANVAASDGRLLSPELMRALKAHRWDRSPTEWSQ